MDMRIDKAGADDLSGDIDLDLALILAHTDDQAVCHGDIRLAKLI